MNVAVVGCGYWGPNLVRNFSALPECQTITCCDSDEEKLQRVKRLHRHVTTTKRFQDVVNSVDIDAVAIATPVATHYSLVRECLLAGKHVLVEKPMAASSQESWELTDLAEKMDRVLMVGHTFEYSVAVNKVREIIAGGELGNIMYLSSQRLNLGPYRNDVNVVWDLAAHDVSIALFLTGKRPIGANAQAQAFLRRGNEDISTATLHFEDGVVALLNDSWLDPHKVRRTTVVGTQKMLVYDDVSLHEKIKIFDKGIDAPAEYETFADFHLSYRYGDIHAPRIEEQEPLKIQCSHFVECILNRSTPATPGASGATVVTVLEAMTKSISQNGAYVPIEYRDSHSGNSKPNQRQERTARSTASK